MKQVKTKSGLIGWQAKLQKVYSSFEEFEGYCDTFFIHKRLGYSSPKTAWKSNPTIQGSTNPTDLCKVKQK